MKIPLLDLAAQHDPLHAELMTAMENVLKSQTFILGPEVDRFEAASAAYSQSAHGIGVSSGTDALLLALMALDIKPGDEVVTTTFSFFATAGVIARLGATPVFVDIVPGTFNIDTAKLARAITPKTKAIIPVHLFGQCADMDPILKIAAERRIPVIEDAAQAIGTEYKGRRAGSLGLMGCFSFFPSKNLGALGDAGLVTTNDAALAERLKVLRVHGSKPKYYHAMIGGNFRIDAIQAAVLNVKLKHLDAWTAARRKNAAAYRELFAKAGLAGSKSLTLPVEAPENGGGDHAHIYNQFVIRVDRRDALMETLKKQNVGCEIYYPVPLHRQECFRDLGHKAGDFPESERAAAETVAIPIFPGLTLDQQKFIVDAIAEHVKKG